MMKIKWHVWAVVLCGVAVPVAHAGRSCEQRPLTPHTLTQGLALAQQTAQALDAEFARSGARVVVLGRAGQDLAKNLSVNSKLLS
jgi:hypothetical protein